MKSRLAFLSIGLLAASAAVGTGCANNSGGGDTGQGGTSASGQGGQTASGSGGTSASTGTGGSSTLTGTGGSSTLTGTGGSSTLTGTGGFGAGSGTGGLSGTTGSGSGGSTGGGFGTGVAGSGAGGATTGTAGTTGGGGNGTGGVAGTTGGGGTGPVTIMAGGASKCAATASATSMLCDGFEGPAIGAAGSVWKDAAGTGSTAVVDATKPYRGMNSVHIKTNGGQGLITETATFNQTGTLATNDNMWGRFFIWFSQTGNPQSHSVFITLEDPTSTLMSAQFHEAGGSRGYLNTGIRFDTPAADHYLPPMGTGMINFDTETPAWHCWEWHTTADAAGNTTSDFYVDGAIDAEMSVTAADKWPLPVFRSMSVGFMQFGTTPATELWIDEVAVDASATPSRIGCDN